jgi:MFS transporter, FHS family, L-fucose permease
MWGFITVMNDFLINTFSEEFKLSAIELSKIQLTFFGAFFFLSLLYFILSNIFKRDPINFIGYKNGMSIALLICGVGASNFYFAAEAESYNQFITSLFILAAGVTLLQICANPYVAILGSESSASKRLNLAQGLNSLGTTIGPIIGLLMVYILFSNQETLAAIGSTYLIYGAVFLVMAVLVKFSKLPAFTNEEKIERGFGVLRHRNLKFGILAIFFYVGCEVAVGSWIGKFAKDPSVMGVSTEAASSFLAFFWGGLMIGRMMASVALNLEKSEIRKNIEMIAISLGLFCFIWLVNGIKVDGGVLDFEMLSIKEISIYFLFLIINFFAFKLSKGKANSMIVIFSTINLILLLIGVFAKGEVAFWSVLGTGLFFSVGWSNIFSLSIKGLGKLTSQGSALLIMAIVGGGLIQYFQAYILDEKNVQPSFLIPAIGMIYLIFFGINGYKKKL